MIPFVLICSVKRGRQDEGGREEVEEKCAAN